MHIKSIVIDGFKSYGQRTEIGPFDSLFNAITGLNGSGKSNILDAICFVLGLSNMSLARVSNLRELIYKNGQTGVIKASVTITFDNKDKERSPSGYDQFNEIVIRREVLLNSRTKYYVNAFNATNQQVADLFHSVQLNINNPHFLIMQGRITKVLNMKPNEILAMVEEATGVSMYELKKKTTRATIEKKDNQLKQVDSLIAETIKPKIEQLKQEQSGLLEYKKVVAELEHLEKKYIVFQYIRAEKICENAGAKKVEKQNKIDALKQLIDQNAEKVNEVNSLIVRLEKQKDEESGGKLKELEEKLQEVQMSDAKQTGDINILKDSLKEEEKELKQLEKLFNDDKKLMASKENEYNKLKDKFESLEEACRNDEALVKKAEKDLEAIWNGLSRASDGKAAVSLTDQLMQAENELAVIGTENQKAENMIKHCKQELIKKESDLKKEKGSGSSLSRSIAEKENDLEKLKNTICHFDEERHKQLIDERHSLKKEIDIKKEETNNMQYKFPQSRFDYNNPTPNFDRSKVYGVVCNLFAVKDSRAFTALEIAAGGKLYNVVVDNEETAKLIFEKSQMKRRCTLLPLNKIEGRDVDIRALRNAEKHVGKENVCSALSLIEYDPRFHNAMKYVFGDVLVCPTMEAARKVAFADDVQKKTVTFDGEVFDPSGTLFGGFLGQRGQNLVQIKKIQKNLNDIRALEDRLQIIVDELNSMNAASQKFTQQKNQIDLLTREINLLKERLQQTNEHLLINEIEKMKVSIKENEDLIATNVERKKKAEKKMKEVQFKLKDYKNVREKELQEAKQMLEKAKKNYEKSQKAIASSKQTVSALLLEIEDLKKSSDSYKPQIDKSEEEIIKISSRIQTEEEELKCIKERVREIQELVKEQKKTLKSQSDEISKLHKQKDRILKIVEDTKLEIKEIEHEISQIDDDSKEANRVIKSLSKKNTWINEEKQLFEENEALATEKGQELHQRIQKLTATKTNLAKTVNMRANIMLSDKEKEAEELSKRRKIIENDKAKLLRYIDEVDQKKKDALYNAWEKINKDFGSIFSTLLPNSNAKLDVPEGKTLLDGLEVRVAFGEVWKESLTELSGGQRSLVALSLILALLLYNPAPIYILDEVDAALDQNHTRNIGNMIKQHFSKSQFIIVSLKDDMFDNANVLFQTKFVDGNSTVKRTEKSKKSQK
ncbi:structural maintenance of chromosomes protein 2-like protein [Dinothrombium tinctorium]|uniref:Structural maintenance of chromosomes protein n=1 Tax=Dinothrombium tinctorium TaxID=1965070 RepID=A0A443QNZ4_9ACAR|nr:structural maintenance of chromosomes protein 2-like protein [Dinothrombium tinctorium]